MGKVVGLTIASVQKPAEAIVSRDEQAKRKEVVKSAAKAKKTAGDSVKR